MTERAAEPVPDPPASTGRIVGVGCGLGVLLLVVLSLTLSPLRPLDASEELGSHFTIGELPFGFRPVDSFALGSGEVVVRLDRDDDRESTTEAIEASVVTADPTGSEDDAASESGSDASDEAKGELADTAEERELHAEADGTPPSLVYLVRYPRDTSLAVLKRKLARKTEGEGGMQSMGDTLALTIDGGRLPWHDYLADFVQEREYEKGGHFTDVFRVNLSLGSECWILYAHWPRDYRGSRAPIVELLDALPPLAAD